MGPRGLRVYSITRPLSEGGLGLNGTCSVPPLLRLLQGAVATRWLLLVVVVMETNEPC